MKKFVTKFLLFMIASVFICLSPLFTNTVKADSGIVDPEIYKADGVTPAEEGEDKDYIIDYDDKKICLKNSDLIITKTAYDSQSNVYYSIVDLCEESEQHTFTLRNFNFDGKTQKEFLFDFSNKKVKLIVDSSNINITNDDAFKCVISGTDLEIIDGPMEGNNLTISCNNTYCSLIKIIDSIENDGINPRLILGNNNEFSISLETCDNEYHDRDSRIIYCGCGGSGSLLINEGTHLSGNRSIEGFSYYELSGKMDISTDGKPCFVLNENTHSFVINPSANILLSSNNLDDIDPTGNNLYLDIFDFNDLILLGSTEVCEREQCTKRVQFNDALKYFFIIPTGDFPKTLYISGYYTVKINGVETQISRGEQIPQPSDPTDDKGGTFFCWINEVTGVAWDYDVGVAQNLSLVPKFIYPDDPDPDDPDPDDPDPETDSGIVDPVIYKADGVTHAEKGEDYILDNYFKQIYLKKSDLIITKTAYDSQSNVYYSIADLCEESGQHTFTLRNFNFVGKIRNQFLFDFSHKKVKLIVDSCNINITNNIDDDDFHCVIAGTDLEIIDGPMEGNNLKISCNIISCSLIYIIDSIEDDGINPQLILGNNNEFSISLETCDNEYRGSEIIFCECGGSSILKINEGTHLSGNRSIEGFSYYELSGKMDISTDGIPCFVLNENTQSFVINPSANILLSSNNLDCIDPTGNNLYLDIFDFNDLILLGSTEVCEREQCTKDVIFDEEFNYFNIIPTGDFPKTLYISGYYTVKINGVETQISRGEQISKPSDPTDDKGGTFVGWFVEGTDEEWDFDADVLCNFSLVPKFIYPDDPDPDDPDPDDPDPDDPTPDDPEPDDPDPDDPTPDDPDPDDPNPDDPDPDDPDPDDPKTKIESESLNHKLSDMINRASKNNGYSVIKFTDYDGNDCLTRDNLKLLDENPNAVLVLDYTFHDINTDKDIHVHAVINKAILQYILDENIIYYGPAKMSGFVQYYNMLPLEIRNMNL